MGALLRSGLIFLICSCLCIWWLSPFSGYFDKLLRTNQFQRAVIPKTSANASSTFRTASMSSRNSPSFNTGMVLSDGAKSVSDGANAIRVSERKQLQQEVVPKTLPNHLPTDNTASTPPSYPPAFNSGMVFSDLSKSGSGGANAVNSTDSNLSCWTQVALPSHSVVVVNPVPQLVKTPLTEMKGLQGVPPERWEIGRVHSCCAPELCHDTGGDIFLAYLDCSRGAVLLQLFVRDLQNGVYSLLLVDTLIPKGICSLAVYLDYAMHRPSLGEKFDKTNIPAAAPYGGDLHLDHINFVEPQFAGVYNSMKKGLVMGRVVDISWPPADLTIFHTSFSNRLASLPKCSFPPYSHLWREGAIWLRIDHSVTCAQVGHNGCGDLGLLLPDQAYHHVYLERDCYYPLQNANDVSACLSHGAGQRVVFIGDSTTRGLLNDVKYMWGGGRLQKSPPYNKSNHCFCCNAGEWECPDSYCAHGGMLTNHTTHFGTGSVEWGGRFLRSPNGKGLRNLDGLTPQILRAQKELATMVKRADILVLHSCDHDLGIRYGMMKIIRFRNTFNNLGRLVTKHGKDRLKPLRVIWLSCVAQGGPGGSYLTNLQNLKWRMNRVAFHMCVRWGFEYHDGFALSSSAIPRRFWFHHSGHAGDIHVHERCRPVASGKELFKLEAKGHHQEAMVAWAGGASYLNKMALQILFHRICAPLTGASEKTV